MGSLLSKLKAPSGAAGAGLTLLLGPPKSPSNACRHSLPGHPHPHRDSSEDSGTDLLLPVTVVSAACVHPFPALPAPRNIQLLRTPTSPAAAHTSRACITGKSHSACAHPHSRSLPTTSSSMFAILVAGARHLGATLESFPSLRPVTH